MNDYDIHFALAHWSWGDTPNRMRLAETVANLAAWADLNSDGWAHWPKPARAAAKAMELLSDQQRSIPYTDATDAETAAALRPIKAFLTRQNAAHDGIISTGENFP